MLTYAEAREAVIASYRDEWLARYGGNFYADVNGYEDADDYCVPVYDPGMRAACVVVLDGGTTVLVSKATGEVRTEPTLACLHQTSAMTEVSV